MPDHPGNNGPAVCQRAIRPSAPNVATSPVVKPRLLDRVRQAVRALHYSPRTEQAYIYWIRRFIFHNGVRHPEQMGAEEVGAFLSHLAVKEHVGASTQNQALNALVFLYGRLLGRDLGTIDVARAKRPHRRSCSPAKRSEPS